MSQSVTVRDNDGSTLPRRSSARVVAPPVDVFESADEILVVADVAGIPGEAIDVRVDQPGMVVEQAQLQHLRGVEPDFLLRLEDVLAVLAAAGVRTVSGGHERKRAGNAVGAHPA